MAKEFKAVMVSGLLTGSSGDTKCTPLGIAENYKEVDEIIDGYEAVFGENKITFWSDLLTDEEYKEERQKAFANLFASLNGPINNLVSNLQTLKKLKS